jgi:hypothetical protein
VEVLFSNHYYLLLADSPAMKSKVAVAVIKVQIKEGPKSLEAMVDTDGAVSIASQHLLDNLQPAKKRGNPQCRMATVNGLTDPYTHQGELHFSDEAGHPTVILCYAQKGPVLGHKDFVLMSNSAIVSMRYDIQYHAESSVTIGAVPLRRLSTEPYHYTDTIFKNHKSGSAASKNPVTREHINSTHESGCKCQPRCTPSLSEVDFLRLTGRN